MTVCMLHITITHWVKLHVYGEDVQTLFQTIQGQGYTRRSNVKHIQIMSALSLDLMFTSFKNKIIKVLVHFIHRNESKFKKTN